MPLDEIKAAVDAGKIVNWSNCLYVVEKWSDGYNIVCQSNQHAIGLTHTDGVTMNGKEEDFFLGE